MYIAISNYVYSNIKLLQYLIYYILYSMNKTYGILDPNGENINPLTGQQYSDEYIKLSKGVDNKKGWTEFPVYKDAKKIIKLINDNQILLVVAATGAGKSVLIPKYALHSLNYDGKVVMTIPKQTAVRKAAEYAAKTLDVELGQEVGFQFRGSKLSNGKPSKSNKTRLLISTDGSIVAQLINDPLLKSYDIVIIDEAHERGIQIDILLLLMKKALKLNPKLKLIVMSATINPEIFKNYFKKDFNYESIELAGDTMYDIEDHFLDKELINPEETYLDAGANTIIKILKETDTGDIMFFVNTKNDGIKGCQLLQTLVKNNNIEKPFCIELAGGVDKEDEDYATNQIKYKNHPNGPFNRKVVLSTNVAESSITVEGLKFVVESGYAYVDGYNPLKMERELLQKRISKAQVKQRKGRVGRRSTGTCYRLYTREEYERFIDYPVVEIRKSELTNEILRFMKMPYVKNIGDLLKLLKELIEPPEDNFVKSALYILYTIGAIDKLNSDGKLTDLGEKLVKFRKLEPIIAKSVINSFDYGIEYDVITLSTLLSKADGKMNTFIKEMKNRAPKNGDKDFNKKSKEYKIEKIKYDKAINSYTSSYGDILTLLKMYKKFREYNDSHNTVDVKKWCNDHYLKYERLKDIKRMSQDIMREVKDIVFKVPKNEEENKKILTYIYNDENKVIDISGKNQLGGFNYNQYGGISSTDESTIMLVLLNSLFMNTAKMTGFNKYKNCYPFEKTTAQIARDSLLSINRDGPKFIVYIQLFNFLGREKYNMVSKIPETTLKKLNEADKKKIADCFIKESPNNRNKKSYNKPKYGKGSGKKSGKGSGKGSGKKSGKKSGKGSGKKSGKGRR